MLIAVSGLAGAGKTTAISFLQKAAVGTLFYVGEYLHHEIRRRGMHVTPDTERRVREDLRARDGMAAMAKLAMPALTERVAVGRVLIDAIYCEEERQFYYERFGERVVVIGIRASMATRASRLVDRPDRPLSVEQLKKRDTYETDKLRIGHVIASANYCLDNESTMTEFERRLEAIAEDILTRDAPT